MAAMNMSSVNLRSILITTSAFAPRPDSFLTTQLRLAAAKVTKLRDKYCEVNKERTPLHGKHSFVLVAVSGFCTTKE